LLISPGPGTPEQAGSSMEIVRWASEIKKPLLGVCLGHQVIARTFGFDVIGAPKLIHGYTSKIEHQGAGIFSGLAFRFQWHEVSLPRSSRGSAPASSDCSQ